MRILFVADGRSPIALNWMSYFVGQGHQVYLASTYSCQLALDLAGLYFTPVALSEAAGAGSAGARTARQSVLRKLVPVGLRTAVRQRLGPLTLDKAARRLQQILAEVQPDLVHAMRIPYEGMLAARADPACPLLVSIWGNDFTLHAASTRMLARLTGQTLARADAVHADCQRDIRLALQWGFPAGRPFQTLPGGGGVQLDLFHFEPQAERAALVVNPRGFRAYIKNEAFFQAIPKILQRQPLARFALPAMLGEAQAGAWIAELGIGASVELLPHLARPEMADLFRRAQVVVSPSTHDGTPNTLLEAMACGCTPVAGDLESIREWITPGRNGLLVDPADPDALADAVCLALSQPDFRRRAAEINRAVIEQRADYYLVMQAAEGFYRQLLVK